jgi:integrase
VARFAFITGWRTLSEILPLQWRQVDFQAGIVTLDPGTTKNKEGRLFPFTAELRALLDEQRSKREVLCPWVFTYKGGHFKSYRRAWKTACRKAGLPGKIPHDFRRTAVRNLVRAGVSAKVAMQMTGHRHVLSSTVTTL